MCIYSVWKIEPVWYSHGHLCNNYGRTQENRENASRRTGRTLDNEIPELFNKPKWLVKGFWLWWSMQLAAAGAIELRTYRQLTNYHKFPSLWNLHGHCWYWRESMLCMSPSPMQAAPSVHKWSYSVVNLHGNAWNMNSYATASWTVLMELTRVSVQVSRQ